MNKGHERLLKTLNAESFFVTLNVQIISFSVRARHFVPAHDVPNNPDSIFRHKVILEFVREAPQVTSESA